MYFSFHSHHELSSLDHSVLIQVNIPFVLLNIGQKFKKVDPLQFPATRYLPSTMRLSHVNQANQKWNTRAPSSTFPHSFNVGIVPIYLLASHDASHPCLAGIVQCHSSTLSSTPPLPCHSSLQHRRGIWGIDKYACEDAMDRSFAEAERRRVRPDQDIKRTRDASTSRSHAQEDVR